jgi:hypothetical protein
MVVSSSSIKSPIKKTTRQSPNSRHQSRIDVSPYPKSTEIRIALLRKHEKLANIYIIRCKCLDIGGLVLVYHWIASFQIPFSNSSFMNTLFLYAKIRKQTTECPKIKQATLSLPHTTHSFLLYEFSKIYHH